MLDKGNVIALTDNRLTISEVLTAYDYFYPESYFDGFTYLINMDELSKSNETMLARGQIDFTKFKEKFLKNTSTYLQFNTDFISELCTKIWSLRGTEEIGKLRLLSALLMSEIFSLPETSTRPSFLTKVQARAIEACKEILCSNLSKRYTLTELSSRLGINENSLKYYFKQVYGVSISDFMNQKRIDFAKELLLTTDLNISDIAIQCGYANHGKFSMMFKNLCGTNPSEYRRISRIKKAKDFIANKNDPLK